MEGSLGEVLAFNRTLSYEISDRAGPQEIAVATWYNSFHRDCIGKRQSSRGGERHSTRSPRVRESTSDSKLVLLQ